MSENLSKIIGLIDSVKATTKCNEVELIGNKESLEKLIESGFSLENYKHQEIPFIDKSMIAIVPCELSPIELYFQSNET